MKGLAVRPGCSHMVPTSMLAEMPPPPKSSRGHCTPSLDAALARSVGTAAVPFFPTLTDTGGIRSTCRPQNTRQTFASWECLRAASHALSPDVFTSVFSVLFYFGLNEAAASCVFSRACQEGVGTKEGKCCVVKSGWKCLLCYLDHTTQTFFCHNKQDECDGFYGPCLRPSCWLYRVPHLSSQESVSDSKGRVRTLVTMP